jgi:type II secretion system protein H
MHCDHPSTPQANLSQNGSADLGSAPASGAVVGALAHHWETRNRTRRSVRANAFKSTGVGAGRHTRGRVCSPVSTGSPHRRQSRKHADITASRQAFTLIELILVLTLLVIVTSLAAPSLHSFFRGRALDSEARQLLALTHAGQSRAISTGFPMLLWIDASSHAYGLTEETASKSGSGSAGSDPKAEEFNYEDQLRIEAVDASPMPVNGRTLPAIRFLPDGTVDEGSATSVRLSSDNGDALWLNMLDDRANYEIRNRGK